MEKRDLGKYRKKSRHIVEIRYKPLLAAFDNRGKLLKNVRSQFASKLEHWKTENVAVHFADNFESPSRHIVVDHLRSFIAYEDPSTEQEFLDDASNLLKVVRSTYGEELIQVSRVGVRYLSIFTLPNISSHEDAINLVRSNLLSPNMPVSFQMNDCRVVLVHDNGSINIGPVKDDEDWVKQTFSVQTETIPKYGIGLDVDSSASNVDFSSDSKILQAVKTVAGLTTSTEIEILDSLLGSE